MGMIPLAARRPYSFLYLYMKIRNEWDGGHVNQVVLVLDFGGQYKELIAKAVRELSVYSKIVPGDMALDAIREIAPIGIILTGGPGSVYADDAPTCDPALFSLGIPVLGICYGMQLICHLLGGQTSHGTIGEYGTVSVTCDGKSMLLKEIASPFSALMSHRDLVTQLPEGFVNTASSASCPFAACEHVEKGLYGLQFHPETAHTEGGMQILHRFLYDICGAAGDYQLDDYIETTIAQIRQQVGKQHVLLALSGGVDSSVCAALLSKAIPGQLTCMFIDHGFMRLDEGDEVERIFSDKALRFVRINAADRFVSALSGIHDPEEKRKRIGNLFIQVFEAESKALGRFPFLCQGTIYPDVVESGGAHGATIKSHHNVGGLPETSTFEGIIEPLRGLFKNEVRVLGAKLGLPSELIHRQPFPGPGLAIRIMGEVTADKISMLQKVDAIVRDILDRQPKKPNQYFAVLTDTYSVGVKGDARAYDPVVAIRAVETDDFMTCQYAPLSHELLQEMSARITAELSFVSRVVYDITSKPPATVEWE